jgi:uncharacterized protein YggE
MTITVGPRRIAVVLAVALGVLAAYVLGSARSAAATSAASTAVRSGAVSSGGVAVQSSQTTGPDPAGITVVGTGTVSGTPDTIVVSFSVNATAANVSSAFSTASSGMAALQKTLRAHGVATKDLQTSNVSVQPSYSTKGTIDGYAVTEGLTATMRDIGKAGDAISAAVAGGRNLVRVDGVSLDLEDSGPLLTRARDDAYAEARSKAEQYAHDSGRALGSVVSISEQAQPAQPQRVYADAVPTAATAFKSLQVSAGSADVVVRVTVTFGLG